VPGRRYVVGKDESSDLRVDGTYTSRRHAEIWLDDDGWHVADAGSTNGLRVESGGADGTPVRDRRDGDDERRGADPRRRGNADRPLGARRGPPADYPSIAVRPHATDAAPRRRRRRSRPARRAEDAAHVGARARPGALALAITATQASGERSHAIAATRCRSPSAARATRRSSSTAAIPASRGSTSRSTRRRRRRARCRPRRQRRRHRRRRARTGQRFDWRPGQTMVLGGALPGEPACTLVLARDGEH
jgi:hypothetical protein